MKKKIQIIIGIVIVVVAAFLYAHISKTHCIYNTEIDTDEYRNIMLLDDVVVRQRFMTSENALDGVRIKCRVNGNLENINIQYVLKEAESDEEVARGTIKGTEVKNSKFTDYVFPTVEQTAEKEYEFIICADGGDEENNIVLCYESENETDTELRVNDQKEEGTIILKTITKRFDFETFCVLLIFVLYIVVFLKFLYRLFKE